ncbi:testicular haploid expressed gene protein-like isoform X1 [Arapaima gigas]
MMMSTRTGRKRTFCPSARILQLARHKESRAVWATTPWELTWGNQEPIWPVSCAALTAVPTTRIHSLAEPKRGISAWDDPSRCVEDGLPRRGSRPASKTAWYEWLARLSAPRTRPSDEQDGRLPLARWDAAVKAVGVSPRLLQLASPRKLHPDFRGDRELGETLTSCSTRRVPITPRLEQLSQPKTRVGDVCLELGPPEEPIRPVSTNARRATASHRIRKLASPKGLSKDYVPHRDPVWGGKGNN